MLGTSQCQGCALNRLTLGLDLLSTSKIDIRWGEIVQRLVVTLLVVMVNEPRNGLLQFPGKVMVLQTDDILERAVVALNLALGHGMEGSPARVAQPMHLKIVCQIC